jgi:hypothetical protein
MDEKGCRRDPVIVGIEMVTFLGPAAEFGEQVPDF